MTTSDASRFSYMRLAVKNVRRSVQDYAIYFLTQVLGVMLFYSFNAFASQVHTMDLSDLQKSLIESLDASIKFISVVVGIVLCFLVVYANRFLIRRRKKEFGTYLLLGMSRSQVCAIITSESVLVGFSSLLCGLGLGIGLSQLLVAVTSRVFVVPMDSFTVQVSWENLGLTCLCFLGIFVLSIVFNLLTVGTNRLITLLAGSRTNDRQILNNVPLSLCVFAIGIAALVCGYVMLDRHGLEDIDRNFLIEALLCGIGTFLFFWGLSSTLLTIVRSSPRLYFKGLNVFTIRTVGSRINRAFISLTLVCLTLFIGLASLTSGLSIALAQNKDLKEQTLFDATAYSIVHRGHDDPTAGIHQSPDLFGMATRELPVLNQLVNQHVQMNWYRTDLTVGSLYHPTKPYCIDTAGTLSNQPVMVIAESEINAALTMVDRPTVSVSDGHYIFWDLPGYCSGYWDSVFSVPKTISISGSTLTSVPASQEHPAFRFIPAVTYSPMPAIIVPDSWLEQHRQQVSLYWMVLNVRFADGADQGAVELQHALDDYGRAHELEESTWGPDTIRVEGIEPNDPTELWWTTSKDSIERARGFTAISSFIAIYIGAVMLIAATAILALQQASDAADNSGRYAILNHLGAPASMIRRSLTSQVALYFFLPLALALSHTGMVLHVLVTGLLPQASSHFNHMSWIVPLLCAVFIYLLYFVATVMTSRSIVSRQSAIKEH